MNARLALTAFFLCACASSAPSGEPDDSKTASCPVLGHYELTFLRDRADPGNCAEMTLKTGNVFVEQTADGYRVTSGPDDAHPCPATVKSCVLEAHCNEEKSTLGLLISFAEVPPKAAAFATLTTKTGLCNANFQVSVRRID